MPCGKKFTAEQIIEKLREAEAPLGGCRARQGDPLGGRLGLPEACAAQIRSPAKRRLTVEHVRDTLGRDVVTERRAFRVLCVRDDEPQLVKRVVRTAIGDGSPTAACPETVLVKAGATIGTPIPVVDVASLSDLETRYAKNLDALEKDFEAVAQTPPAPTPWSEWRFRADPDQRGLEEGWQRTEFDANAWKPIRVPAVWSSTHVGTFVGYGWYRTTFLFPPEWAGEPVHLQFGGVDDQAWVYVNGELVGEQLAARPFTVTIPAKLLRPGVQNTLVVRVLNSGADGGILKAVSGGVPHPENRRRLPLQPAQSN